MEGIDRFKPQGQINFTISMSICGSDVVMWAVDVDGVVKAGMADILIPPNTSFAS